MPIRTIGIVIAIAAMMMIAGCGRDRTVEGIRRLRVAGELDSARTAAVEALEEKSSRMDVWNELAQISIGLSKRNANRIEDGYPYIIQAALLCGSMYEYREHKPGREWIEAGKQTSGEIARMMNIILKKMQEEARVASQNQQLREYHGSDSRTRITLVETEEKLADYRSGSKDRIAEAVTLLYFFHHLPEWTAGTHKVITDQFDVIFQNWRTELGLSDEYCESLQEQTQALVEREFQDAGTDLRQLGYWLPATILDNEVQQ